jgi:hypothetical protein
MTQKANHELEWLTEGDEGEKVTEREAGSKS